MTTTRIYTPDKVTKKILRDLASQFDPQHYDVSLCNYNNRYKLAIHIKQSNKTIETEYMTIKECWVVLKTVQMCYCKD